MPIKLASVIVAMMLQTAPSHALAADWKLAAETDETATFIDTKTVKKEGGKVRFWSHTVMVTPNENGMDNYKSLISADCYENSYTKLTTSYFKGDRPSWTDDASRKISYAVPESLMEAVLNAVCGNAYLSQSVPDPYELVIGFYRK